MIPEDFDSDLLGFGVSVIGMIVCVLGSNEEYVK